ncbi:uncharacterized protein LOC127249183 isoform X2 [Andrographis paniculata]|uniref:uncharacterized protein LOC127249183 isoform X2 n=1 Tax=Andrographis paniculata TaxID=175694 RepID=UPI0021E75851|nr:uncharacterized protein LOC127249183 isoform X2 [Andrographis paniculata]
MLSEEEKNEASNSKEQEKPERSGELGVFEKSCDDKNLNINSVIDVSGKRLDFPLILSDDSGEVEVEEVYMYKNELNLIPTGVGRLKSLKTLKFFANEVNLFPGEFKNLVGLQCLQVKITEPGVSALELSKLGDLKELELSRAPPRPSSFSILSEIGGLKCLTRLSVCHFSIRYLPPEIGCLSNLEYLDLSFNKMRNLPGEIASLNSLTSLKIANNKLVELPLGLSNLQRLENMDLSNNRLTSLGCLELESMYNLHSLNLQHNRLRGCHIPSWICCNLEGNYINFSNEESSEMDVYEGPIEEIQCSPCSPLVPSSHLNGTVPNNRCLAARKAKGWKRQHNLKTKSRQERVNGYKKWKVDSTSLSSLGKSKTCRVCVDSDAEPSGSVSVVSDEELDNKDIFLEGDLDEISVIDPGNKDIDRKKGSAGGCSCPRIDSDGCQANKISESPSVRVFDEASSSEHPNCLIKSKRHSDGNLDNPKPTKSRRPTNNPSFLSSQYSESSFCGVEDFLPDGFYDAGRDRPFMSLASYDENAHVNSREVIVLDRERDEALDIILLRARALVSQFRQMNSFINRHKGFAAENLQIASLLALFVSDHFGGSDKSAIIWRTRKSVSGSNFNKPFVCTCATGNSSNTDNNNKGIADTSEDIVFWDICEKSLQSIKTRNNSIIVPIGGLQFGICRHRALLMKYLCDRMEPRIPCELVRGYLDFSPHAWNVIIVKRGDSSVRMIVDACHPHDIRKESDPEYFRRYTPLSRANTLVADHDISPNGAFPSFSECDKFEKFQSTSLMCCKVGSIEAALKVRTIDVNGASSDDIRNFELSCLGEIRILSVLKNPCIVEFYGHQISSQWTKTPDGELGGRKLQSAILMEYIKGGSLKSYLEKLSTDGEKHIALELALSIARDVAFALTEIHAKLIIHRDIKIPVHSHMHTCCIAHVGIPPPNICVGTPRWMAPEVFGAMHKPNTYGLEIDIWSFGCLLVELLTLRVPFSGLQESEIHNLLQRGERPNLTDELDALAQSGGDIETESDNLTFLAKLYHLCTEKKPSDRPSADYIYKLLHARTTSSNTSSATSDKE